MISELSEEVVEFLEANYRWEKHQPPEAIPPVLVILNYAPDNDMHPLSIAFDLSGGPKCWLSESSLQNVNGHCPAYHLDYRKFEYEGIIFHPYSIQSFKLDIFSQCANLISACNELYAHTKFDKGNSQ